MNEKLLGVLALLVGFPAEVAWMMWLINRMTGGKDDE